MSGNPLRQLKQLPETEAITLFNCRNCSLSEIASAAFLDVPFIYRVDLAYNELTGNVVCVFSLFFMKILIKKYIIFIR